MEMMVWKSFFVTLFALSVVVSVEGRERGPVKEWVGRDANVLPQVLANAVELFSVRIPFAKATVFDVNDAVQTSTALLSAEVVYLCPSNISMALSSENIVLLQQFVFNGGILIYPAGFNDARSKDVSGWLNETILLVNSSKSAVDVDRLYYPYLPEDRGNFLNRYLNPHVALATNQSLFTAFGRISPNNQFGLPFQWFSGDLYWVKDNIHHMILTAENRKYCMFQREGTYAFSSGGVSDTSLFVLGDYDEACWVNDFPLGRGHVVETSITFETSSALDDPFAQPFIGAIAAAVGLVQRVEENFLPKANNVLLKYRAQYIPIVGGMEKRPRDLEAFPPIAAPRNGDFVNLAYDLSLTNTVFAWKRTDNLDELRRLRSLSGAESFVLSDLSSPLFGKGPIASPFLGYYADMITKGDNLVSSSGRYQLNTDIKQTVVGDLLDSVRFINPQIPQ